MERRRRSVLRSGLWSLVAGVSALVPAAMAEAAEVMVYSARAHYGQEPAMEAFTKKTGIQVKSFGGEAGPALRAAEGRGRPHARRRPDQRRRRQPLERRPRRSPRKDGLAGDRAEHPGAPARSRRALGGAHGARPHHHVQQDQGEGRGALDLRGARRPEVEGPPLHAHLEPHLQPVAARHDDQAAGRGQDREHREELGGQRPHADQRRHQDPRGDRRRAVRRGYHQHLLSRSHPRQGRQLPGRRVLGEPADDRHAREHLRGGRDRPREEPGRGRQADRVPDEPRGAADVRRLQLRVPGQPAGGGQSRHRQVGRLSSRTTPTWRRPASSRRLPPSSPIGLATSKPAGLRGGRLRLVGAAARRAGRGGLGVDRDGHRGGPRRAQPGRPVVSRLAQGGRLAASLAHSARLARPQHPLPPGRRRRRHPPDRRPGSRGSSSTTGFPADRRSSGR